MTFKGTSFILDATYVLVSVCKGLSANKFYLRDSVNLITQLIPLSNEFGCPI